MQATHPNSANAAKTHDRNKARRVAGSRPYLRKNILGQTFTRWKVLRDLGVVDGKYQWECQCSCGVVRAVSGGALLAGDSKSCGCLQRDTRSANGKKHTRHGMKRTRVYKAWLSMRQRCSLRSHPSYERYGGRGISVCRRWQKFENFFADMGHPEDGQSLDRVDNDGDYGPRNCRWADAFTQCRNKSNNKLLSALGETKNLSAWAEDPRCVVPLTALTKRLLCGWTAVRAITEPHRFKRLRRVAALADVYGEQPDPMPGE